MSKTEIHEKLDQKEGSSDRSVIFVISRFGFEGWNWVLIASVSDLCIFINFTCCSNIFIRFLFKLFNNNNHKK